MGQTLQRQVPAHLICIYHAPTEAVSQALSARLRASRCESLQFVCVTRDRWFWGKSSWWAVAAEDATPPPGPVPAQLGAESLAGLPGVEAHLRVS